MSYTRKELLVLYKQLLRSAETFPSKNRQSVYQAIRDEWRDYMDCNDTSKLQRQITVAYKGLSQLRQYDVQTMTSGTNNINSPNWTVTLEQNPMPKPANYDDEKKQLKE